MAAVKTRPKKALVCPLCRSAEVSPDLAVVSAPIPVPARLVLCRVCRNAFNHPRPTDEEAEQFFLSRYHESGDRQLWSGEEMTPIFISYLRHLESYHTRLLAPRREKGERRLLDVGSGTGRFWRWPSGEDGG